jgi:hypothetical protein
MKRILNFETQGPETNLLTKEQVERINANAIEFSRLITCILKPTKANLKN